jgi:ABC-2 type transport system permease protein
MAPDRVIAVADRVLHQIRRDHRSVAMVIVVPCLLLWMLEITFRNVPGVFNNIGPMLLGTFPFVMIFLVTSITMLRERNQGTLDRMLVSPIGRAEIMVGYAAAFAVVAALQCAVTMTFARLLLDMSVRGSTVAAFVIVLLIALYGNALGLTLSAFARSEFQAVQFMPLFLLPQIFLSGLLVPAERMPRAMEVLASVNPLTYVFRLLSNVMNHGAGFWDADNRIDIAIAVLVPLAVLALGASTMRRQTES